MRGLYVERRARVRELPDFGPRVRETFAPDSARCGIAHVGGHGICFVAASRGDRLMTEPSDMSTPVTRGELREELQTFEQKWRDMMRDMMRAMEARLMAELGRLVTTIDESFRSQFGALDDKYADLPARVGKLEAKVFPPTAAPPRRARRRRAG
jgi:hypothetical protein